MRVATGDREAVAHEREPLGSRIDRRHHLDAGQTLQRREMLLLGDRAAADEGQADHARSRPGAGVSAAGMRRVPRRACT